MTQMEKEGSAQVVYPQFWRQCHLPFGPDTAAKMEVMLYDKAANISVGGLTLIQGVT